jgi:hypothetical protein
MVAICLNDLAKGRKGFWCKRENRYSFDWFYCHRRRLKWCSGVGFYGVTGSGREVRCGGIGSLRAIDSDALDTTIRIYGKLYVRVGNRTIGFQCKEVPTMRSKLDWGQNLCPIGSVAIWYFVFAVQRVEFTGFREVSLEMCCVNFDCS